MSEWKSFCLGDLSTFKYGKMPDKKKVSDLGKYPVYSGYRYVGYCDEYNIEAGQLIIVARGVGGTGDVKLTKEKCWLTNLSIAAKILDYEKVIPQYLYYLFKINNLRYLDSGSAQSQITIFDLEKVKVDLPPLVTQKKIAAVLSALDDKIELNNAINRNLEEQAQVIFKNMFPAVISDEISIGEYVTPKRGKGLLVKDTIRGDVPVVAGGIEPATYHNESNTSAPVLTISASGANAGYVRLWNISVWSSDSSFIDSSMTEDVYFWYVMLKLRQKEIFDSQMGTAQPHIYPKHIAKLPIKKLDGHIIKEFTKRVTPLFSMIGANTQENEKLGEIRDALLPRLMSGEIDVSSIEI